MSLDTKLTPAYLATLGFLLALSDTVLNGSYSHDIALALVSSASGMYMQSLKGGSNDGN